jgi:hypothetical protein
VLGAFSNSLPACIQTEFYKAIKFFLDRVKKNESILASAVLARLSPILLSGNRTRDSADSALLTLVGSSDNDQPPPRMDSTFVPVMQSPRDTVAAMVAQLRPRSKDRTSIFRAKLLLWIGVPPAPTMIAGLTAICATTALMTVCARTALMAAYAKTALMTACTKPAHLRPTLVVPTTAMTLTACTRRMMNSVATWPALRPPVLHQSHTLDTLTATSRISLGPLMSLSCPRSQRFAAPRLRNPMHLTLTYPLRLNRPSARTTLTSPPLGIPPMSNLCLVRTTCLAVQVFANCPQTTPIGTRRRDPSRVWWGEISYVTFQDPLQDRLG